MTPNLTHFGLRLPSECRPSLNSAQLRQALGPLTMPDFAALMPPSSAHLLPPMPCQAMRLLPFPYKDPNQ